MLALMLINYTGDQINQTSFKNIVLPISHDLDIRSRQLMVVGVDGVIGHPARSHVVMVGHRSELVRVTIQNPRVEVKLVSANQSSLTGVLRLLHAQVSMW